MQEEDDLPPREFFDDEFAERLIGKTLLVGITHEDHNGRYLRRSQFYGRIIAADRRQGYVSAVIREKKCGFLRIREE